MPALAGLVAGLVIFGTGGWFLGRGTAPDPGTTVVAQPSASAVPSVGAYDQFQIASNGPRFTGPLAPLGEGWLSRLSSCSRNGEKSGPNVNAAAGEKARVRCEMDAMSVIFVEYNSTADRDKARVTTLGQNIEARKLTTGVAEPVVQPTPTPSGRVTGNYVEYAYQVSGRTVAGIWWDDSATPVAAYVLAYWKEGIGQKWDPLREVWARYA
ncbi:hypothetical protein [Actinoplanes sp. NPDC051494]|uniref:hypothetical protein n=1 Tax=Actinoplanes sp. NPDC051494 TaxID=3363907 RepID=UPI00379F6CF4